MRDSGTMPLRASAPRPAKTANGLQRLQGSRGFLMRAIYLIFLLSAVSTVNLAVSQCRRVGPSEVVLAYITRRGRDRRA